MSSIEESISCHSSSLSPSLKSEANQKITKLLKTFTTKNDSSSQENLVDKIELSSITSKDSNDRISLKINKCEEEEIVSKKLILNKFLNDSNSLNTSITDANTVIPAVKMPVPKPRKNKSAVNWQDSLTSIESFNAISAKIGDAPTVNQAVDSLNSDFEASMKIKPKPRKKKMEKATTYSQIITGNYDMESPKELIGPKVDYKNEMLMRSDSLTSVRTFNVTSPTMKHNYVDLVSDNDNNRQTEVVGDLVLHQRNISKSDIHTEPDEVLEKADDETLIDVHSSQSTSSLDTLLSRQSESNKFDRIDILDEKPKPKQRLKIKKSGTNKDEGKKDLGSNSNDSFHYDYQYITEIKIHKTDKLLLNSYVIHPVVKIHIIDIRTGKYFKKSDKKRPVVFYYESDNNDYILPVMSSCYNMQEQRSFVPSWEESILLNEDFQYLINENVLIFFEILDFSTTNFETVRKIKGCEKGWYKVAFAFLKVVSNNIIKNTDKKVRLQLYYPQNSHPTKQEHNSCPLWDWWKDKKLKKYPSTLYVSIRKVVSPIKVIDTFRSKTPLQKETMLSKLSETNDDLKVVKVKQEADVLKQKCHQVVHKKGTTLPDECSLQLETSEEGCFVLKFSNNGLYLACSVKIMDDFHIVIYLVKNFEEIFRFRNHQALVYSISWSKEDTFLLTASSDNTVVIWNFENRSFFQILPHPSFVYTSEINSENTIATGCYDKTLRIWSFNQEENKFLLYQELEGHKGFITSICFTHKSIDLVYSADSCGQIFEWKQYPGDWKLNRNIDIMDLRETKINQIMIFQNDMKMLVHSRDSALRIISVPNACVIHWLYGALNTRIQTFCDISPKMPYYVASGSENGLVLIWDSKTGQHIKTYEGFSKNTKIAHCVRFHPKLNMLAISHYGTNEPILFFFEKSDNKIENTESTFHNVGANDTFQPGSNYENIQHEKVDFRKVLQKMDQLLD